MKKVFFIITQLLIVNWVFAQNYIGDGGKDISLAVLPISAQGLTTAENYLPNMIQGSLISNFVKYSAISVVDRLKLDVVLAETESRVYYDNADYGRLGQVASVDYFLIGTITKTRADYFLQFQIIETRQATVGRTRASFSGQFTLAEIEDATAIQKATLELLTQLEVVLTEAAKRELMNMEPVVNIAAQRALAQGLVAKTEVEALSYFLQAAAFDPSLLEATSRSVTLQTNINTGNIGADMRNDITLRKEWIDRLTELENFIHSINQSNDTPFTFYYTTDIVQSNINYKRETATLSIEATFIADAIRNFTISEVIRTVYAGLNSTGRKSAWGLEDWPKKPITNLDMFSTQNQDFSIIFELVNDKNKIIGKQTVRSKLNWKIDINCDFIVNSTVHKTEKINFQNIKIRDITDNMTIRVAGTGNKKSDLKIVSVDLFPIRIGSRGPSGGIIFYDKGMYSDGWRYLEAAPASSEFYAVWGVREKDVKGTKTAIGTGKANTQIIVASLQQLGETGRAAQLCVALDIGGKNDWFLPSKDELNLMYINLFSNGLKREYWSSSQYRSDRAWLQGFTYGAQYTADKGSLTMVRAVRAF